MNRWVDIGMAMDERIAVAPPHPPPPATLCTGCGLVPPAKDHRQCDRCTHKRPPVGLPRACKFCGAEYIARPGKGCPSCRGKGHQ